MNIPGYRLPMPPPVPPCCGRAPNPLLPGTLQWPLPLLKEWFNSRADSLVDMALERISVGSGFYRLPDGGIPLLDLSDEVRTILGSKADRATTLAGYGVTDAYTKTEVNNLVAATGGKFIVVQSLPAAATADPKAVYLVPRQSGESGNIFDEYLRVEPTTSIYAWEKIGSTDIDLSNYVQTTDSRLSDARTPTAHRSSHATGGADALSPADIGAAQASHTHPQSDVTGLADALAGKREKGDLAVYKKVGVGETWTLVSDQGEPVITTEAIGEYTGTGWAFYVNGELVAGADTGLETDYEVAVWQGAPEIGGGGTAHRPWEYQSVDDDGLAKTSYVDGRTVLTPVYSQTPTFSLWTIFRQNVDVTEGLDQPLWQDEIWVVPYDGADMLYSDVTVTAGTGENATGLAWTCIDTSDTSVAYVATRTRTDIIGYTLGDQSTKPLQPKGEYAPATNIPKTALASGVQTSLGLADTAVQPAALAGKLDSSSAAPAFDTTETYQPGDYVTYNGGLYRFTAAHPAGAWNSAHVAAQDMTSPDATVDIMGDGALRVVAADGSLLWRQGYNLATESSNVLACDKVGLFTFAAPFSAETTYAKDARVTYNGKPYKFNAAHSAGAWVGTDAEEETFAMPTAATGKVGDFGLYIDNTANASAAEITLYGLDNTFSVVVSSGVNLSTDILSFAAGELAVLYFTLTPFRVNNLPTWHVLKQVVENGGAPS